ncbi:MAG TPA: hypothetical protein VGD91_12985 [Trebonia sp.]
MAGHRKGTAKPLKRHAGAARRKARLVAELAAASSATDRVAAAADYLRAALRQHPAEQVAAEVIAELVQVGDQVSAARRHDRIATALEAAGTVRDRVGIAADYVRSALAGYPAGAPAADTAVGLLIAAGDQIHREQEPPDDHRQ